MAKQSNSTVSNQINMIGEGTVFEGTLKAEGDVRISGRIIGTLEIKGKVIIAQEGAVEGEVKAMNLDIGGQVRGDIDVEERVVLKSSSKVNGNIHTARLVVEEGAVFNGQCQMGNRTLPSEAIAPEAGRERVREMRKASGHGDGL